ncbi:MAG TPA: hypothetical protein VFQ65_29835 [Kofleriaceae bacterium]|nr:hypothetical protein [Kofleriaceae bacterium]
MRAVLLVLASCAASSSAIRPDVTAIADGRRWQAVNIDARASSERDKRVVTIGPIGGNRKGSNVGMALVTGVAFAEGTIEVDLRGLGEANASFVGIAFGVADPTQYEALYFRPFRFRAIDPIERSHAVQYVAWPEHTWETLRAQAAGKYEAAIAPVPDPAGWFHARIEVRRTTVKVFVDHAAQPALVVERLGHAVGGVGLWVDSQPASFANLEIYPS